MVVVSFGKSEFVQEVFSGVFVKVMMKREPIPLTLDFICEFLHVRFAVTVL